MARPRSGGNALYVVASNCPARLRSGRDYVCTGTNDEETINRAISELLGSHVRPGLWTAAFGGAIRLSPGSFNLSAPINVMGNLTLLGSNIFGTRLINASGNPMTMLRWKPPFDVDEPTYVSGTTTVVVSGITATANQHINKFLRVKRGLNAGEKRLITSNTATSGGNTSFVLASGFTNTCDATTKFAISGYNEFGFTMRDLTVDGNRYAFNVTSGVKALRSTSVGAQTDAKFVDNGSLVDITGTPVTGGFPAWVVGCPLYICSGAGLGQLRYIEGIGTTNTTNDTLLLDGPWWPALDNTSVAYIGGSALSLWGSQTSDLNLDSVFLCNTPGWNITAEYTWGAKCVGGYWEFADLGGMYVSQSPLYVAVTDTWNRSNTTGQQANIGPTLIGVKSLANGRITASSEGGHGVMYYGRVVDPKHVGIELGSDHPNFDGMHAIGGYGGLVTGGTLVGGTASSWDDAAGLATDDNAGVYLGPDTRQWTVVGNTMRLNATDGATRAVEIAAGGIHHIVAGNALGSPTGTNTISDADGRSVHRANICGDLREQDIFEGWVSSVWDGTSILHTFARPLITCPTGSDFIVMITCRDAQTALAGWAGYCLSNSNTQLTIVSPNASTGTTTVDAVAGAGTYTINITDSSIFREGGQFVIDSGANEETVTVVSIPGVNQIRGTFTKAHAGGVAIKPRYRFWVRVAPECRSTGNG